MKFLNKIIFTACFLNFLYFCAHCAPVKINEEWLDRLEVEPHLSTHKSNAAVHPAPEGGDNKLASNYENGYRAFNAQKYDDANAFFSESKFPPAKSMRAYMYARELAKPDASTLANGLEGLLIEAGTPVATANRGRLYLAKLLKPRLLNEAEAPQSLYEGERTRIGCNLLKESGTSEAKKDLETLTKAGLYKPEGGCCIVM